MKTHFLKSLVTLSIATFVVGIQAQTPPKPGAPKRFPQITLEQIPAESQPLAQEIIKISSVGLAGPYCPTSAYVRQIGVLD